jgi:hypothetical protein
MWSNLNQLVGVCAWDVTEPDEQQQKSRKR